MHPEEEPGRCRCPGSGSGPGLGLALCSGLYPAAATWVLVVCWSVRQAVVVLATVVCWSVEARFEASVLLPRQATPTAAADEVWALTLMAEG